MIVELQLVVLSLQYVSHRYTSLAATPYFVFAHGVEMVRSCEGISLHQWPSPRRRLHYVYTLVVTSGEYQSTD